jgi:hypothetical protein
MNRRILVLTCILAFTLISLPAFSQTTGASSHAAIEKQLLANERAVNDAVAKNDMKAFHALVSSDAIGVDSGGITKINNPEFDKMMAQAKIQSWNIDSTQFQWIDDSTVVMMYKWTGKGTFAGQPIPSPVWTSTVWTNKGGKWTAIFHQETAAMAAPPAASPAPAGKK